MFFLTGFFLALIMIPLNEYFLFVFAVCARGAVFGAFAAIYAYTPEMYPTVIRSIALGTCGSISRIGGMATPFVSNLLTGISPYIPMIIYSLICFVSTIVALLLPIETKGMNLVDSVEAPTTQNISNEKPSKELKEIEEKNKKENSSEIDKAPTDDDQPMTEIKL